MRPKTSYRLLATLTASLISLTACESIPSNPPAQEATTVVTAPSQSTVIVIADEANPTTPPQQHTQQQPQPSQPPVTATPTYPANQPNHTDATGRTNPLTSNPSVDPSTETSIRNPITTEPATNSTAPSNAVNKSSGITLPSNSSPIIITPTEPQRSTREALLERARQNSQSRTASSSSNGEELPAFQRLMKNGIAALQANRLSDAESNFTRAQRLAPRSSAVYFYLSQVAIKKNQPRKAEAMARRGLVVTQDPSRRRALWQLILRSGQMQNNSRVIAEATQALR